MSDQKRAIIVGAGVGGLTTAWQLSLKGWHCIVVERNHNLRSGGYVIGLSGPGYKAIERMGLTAQLESVAREFYENIHIDPSGKEVLRLRYNDLLQDLKSLLLTRADLIKVLAEQIEQQCPNTDIRLNTSVSQIIQNEDKVTAILTDGNELEADLLIGADGVNSTVRKQVWGNDPEHHVPLGYHVAGFYSTDTVKPANCAVTYAIPGCSVEAYSIDRERIAVLYLWKSDSTSPCNRSEQVKAAKYAFQNNHPQSQQWLNNLTEDEPFFYDDMQMIQVPKWSKGRVMLLGDAAHCLTLVSGQGAGMAMVSAKLLAENLDSMPIDEALKKHEETLRPAIDSLQTRSLKVAPWYIPSTPMAFWLRNLMMKRLPQRLISKYLLKSIQQDIKVANDIVDSAL